MRKLNGRRLQVLWVLSILVPISLLTTFRFTGVLHEPALPETITVDEVTWMIERPSKYTLVGERLENVYNDYATSINVGVSIHEYFENSLRDPYWNRDGLSFTLNVDATATQGIIESIVIEFYSDISSTIYPNPTPAFSSFENARARSLRIGTGVTCIEARVLGSPCSMKLPVEWAFTDQNPGDHQLKVNIEAAYFDGRTRKTIVVPFVLKVLTVFWRLERPSSHVYVNEMVENSYTSDEISARISVLISVYEENSHGIPFVWGQRGRDGFSFGLYVDLAFAQGFVESITISFHPLETTTALYVHSSREGIMPPLREHNLSVTEIEPLWWAENRGDAFIRAEASRSPCGLETTLHWVFDDENNQSHQLEVTLEISYFNENTYQDITVPIMLAVPIAEKG